MSETDDDVLRRIRRRIPLEYQRSVPLTDPFRPLPRLVRKEVVMQMNVSDLERYCHVNRAYALQFCGVGEISAGGPQMADIIYEHWQAWLERDFGLSHTPNRCRAFAPLERNLIADSMERWIAISQPGLSNNLERVRRFRQLYKELFLSAQEQVDGGIRVQGFDALFYRDGIVLVTPEAIWLGEDRESTWDYGSYVAAVSIVDVVQRDLNRRFVLPKLLLFSREDNVAIDVYSSGTQTGFYLFVESIVSTTDADPPYVHNAVLARVETERVVLANVPTELFTRLADLHQKNVTTPNILQMHQDPLHPENAYMYLTKDETGERTTKVQFTVVDEIALPLVESDEQPPAEDSSFLQVRVAIAHGLQVSELENLYREESAVNGYNTYITLGSVRFGDVGVNIIEKRVYAQGINPSIIVAGAQSSATTTLVLSYGNRVMFEFELVPYDAKVRVTNVYVVPLLRQPLTSNQRNRFAMRLIVCRLGGEQYNLPLVFVADFDNLLDGPRDPVQQFILTDVETIANRTFNQYEWNQSGNISMLVLRDDTLAAAYWIDDENAVVFAFNVDTDKLRIGEVADPYQILPPMYLTDNSANIDDRPGRYSHYRNVRVGTYALTNGNETVHVIGED